MSQSQFATSIQLSDKHFVPYIDEDKILARIQELASDLDEKFKGKQPLFIGILNGCFMFASDLFKQLELDAEISFCKLASYEGTQSTGQVKHLLGLNESVKDRDLVLIEDIIDTGNTMAALIPALEKMKPKSIHLVSLLLKPKALQHDIKVDQVGFEIPNDFIVGYGLDYNGLGRNLRSIYQLAE